MRKRILALALCLALALSLFPAGALAAEDTTVSYAVEGGNIYFDPSTGTITDCDTSVTSADIPSVINGVPVTSIGDYAFRFCRSLSSVSIPDSVMNIGEEAFYACDILSSVNIPDSVTSIGNYAFEYCRSLSSVSIPDGVTSIGNGAFSYCSSLTSVSIPGSVTSIGDYVFWDCSSLTSASIPDSVTSIGNGAFSRCSSLTSVRLPDHLTSIGTRAFSACGNLTSVSIPDGVTSIGKEAFSGCSSLTSVNIPDGVTSIGEEAFSCCSSLSSVSIPGSVTSIGDYAFRDCSGLTSVVISAGVTSISDSMFYCCSSLASVTIQAGVTSIGERAFSYCSSLSSVSIPEGVTSIGYGAFSSCSSLTKVTIPDSLTSLGEGAFFGCRSLTENNLTVADGNQMFYMADGVLFQRRQAKDGDILHTYLCANEAVSYRVPDGVTEIAAGAFSNDWDIENWGELGNLKEINTNQVVKIRESAFRQSCLTKVIMERVEEIGMGAFMWCTSLSSVKIPDGVTSIGQQAFENCISLTNVTIPDSMTSIDCGVFSGCSSLTSVSIPDSVTSIGEWAFYKCSSLSSASIPNSVTNIGEWAFGECSSLTNVNIPDGVTSISDAAFCGCSSLTSVSIPDSVTGIGYGAFSRCSSLTSVRLPDRLTSIGNRAFSACDSLSSVSIPDSVTSIDIFAFAGCSSLTSVTIPDHVTRIAEYVFYSCSNLSSVSIPNSVTSIDRYAFSECSSLNNVSIPNSVTSIGNNAFSECSSLNNVSIPNSVTSIDDYAFSGCASLTDVYYAGTEEEWNKISIGDYNTALTDATIHYNGSLNVSSSQLYLVNCAPKNLCVSIEQAALLSFQFNRNVTAGVGGIKLWNGDTGTLVVSVPANDMRVSIQLNKVQVKLDPDIFEGDTTYFVTIDNGSFVSGSLRFHGVTGEKTWTFATDPSPVSESFPLKYAKKPGIFGTNDMSKPPVPNGNKDDYAAALAEWAKELGVTDITQKTAKNQLDKKVYLPVTQQNAANNADPILLWDKGTTVQQVMSDLIFVENLQPYIAEMDRELQEIERITNDRVAIPGLTLHAEADVCEKAISWYGQINSYLNGRNQNSNFMLSVAAPFATALLANLSKSTEGDYYSFIKPFVKAELNHQANKATLSALENAGTYDEYTQAADDFELVLDAADLYKATVEDGYPGVGGVISFGADLLTNTFEYSDNDTLKEISKSYKTLKTTKTALKLSMAMGSSIGMFPLVVDLHNDLWRGVEAQAKALYFIGDYYISEQYPALYESVYSDGSFFPTKQPLMPGVSYGEYQYIVEAYQQNPDDAVLFNWTQAFRGNLETSQRDKLLHLRKELTNYAVLLNYIKSIDVEQAKANLVKYVSAEMHQEKTTTNYVSCPVQINIYDKDHTELLASLSTEDTDIQTVDYGSLYLLGEDNQTKCFVYRSGEYSVEIVPYEEGTMDMMMIERDENGAVSGRYYQTVDLKQGEVFTSGEEGLYKRVDGEETVIPETEQVPAAWVSLSCPDRLAMGETAQLEAQVLPVIAAEQAISWSSSDPAVLSVDESGKITAQKTGTATITASAAGTVTAEQTVEVYVPVTALSVGKESVTMLTGETITPELIGSEGADLSRVRWSSGNPAVVGVAQDGTIEGLSPGKALITGAVDDVEVSYSVQVYKDPLDVTIYQSDGDGDRIKLELNNYSSGTPFSGTVYTAVYEPSGRLHCVFTDELTLEAGESKLCFYPVEDLQTEQKFIVKTIVADKSTQPLQPLKSEILLGGEIEC